MDAEAGSGQLTSLSCAVTSPFLAMGCSRKTGDSKRFRLTWATIDEMAVTERDENVRDITEKAGAKITGSWR